MKVLLVDDHPLILNALQAMILHIRPGVEVTGLNSAAALRRHLADRLEPDLLLLDLELGDSNGFELLTEVRTLHPEMAVVVISASDRPSDVIKAVDLGAMGYLPKRMSNEDLAQGLRLVMDGGVFVPTLDAGAQAGATAPPPRAPAEEAYQTLPTFEEQGLTPRQAEVLTLLLQGKSNKEIARRLNLSVETVKDHVQAVLRALGVSSRTQAVLAVGEFTRRGRVTPA